MADGLHFFDDPAILAIVRKLQSVGFPLNAAPAAAAAAAAAAGNHQETRAIFNQLTSLFFNEIYQGPAILPLPVYLGDGQHVDLFKIYRAVHERGGYGSVSAAAGGSWSSVAEDVGLEKGVAPSLKLVYVKYLAVFERWLEKVLAKKADGKEKSSVGDSGLGVDGFASDFAKENEEVDAVGETPVVGSKAEHFLTPTRAKTPETVPELVGDDVAAVNVHEANGETPSSLKRKRETLIGILNWVRNVSKSPGSAKETEHSTSEHYKKACLAREAMLLKGVHEENSNGSSLKEPIVILSSPKENKGAAQMPEQTRFSQRIRLRSAFLNRHSGTSTKTSPFNECSAGKTLARSAKEGGRGDPKVGILGVSHEGSGSMLNRGLSQNRVWMGSCFQAEVPDWVGVASAARSNAEDSKWCGTLIWSPANLEEAKQSKGLGAAGEGERGACLCKCPGSVECVRFHVSEQRLRLKRELGRAFYDWGFNNIGEEVSLSWAEEEEQVFKSTVLRNKNFWHQPCSVFPHKKRRELVRYYFNVFLLQRRGYQNRVTPDYVDSDDEEEEFGFLSNLFGRNALRVSESEEVLCAQNMPGLGG